MAKTKGKTPAKKTQRSATGKNERNTENLVRNVLRELKYYAAQNEVRVEEQKSGIEAVSRLLKTGSKSGKGGKGAPEFWPSHFFS